MRLSNSTSGLPRTTSGAFWLLAVVAALSATSYTAVNAQCNLDYDPCAVSFDGCLTPGFFLEGVECCDCDTGLQGVCGLSRCIVEDVTPTTPTTPAPIALPTTPTTPAPITLPTTPTTSSPIALPTTPATSSPIALPTTPTTPAPIALPTTPAPITVVATPAPTASPVEPASTFAPAASTTLAPVDVEEPAATLAPSPAVEATTPSPSEPEDDDDGDDDDGTGTVEAGTKTTVTVSASAYDTRPGEDSGDVGCGEDGCLPTLTRDGEDDDDESRWSCAKKIVPDEGQCEIEFTFSNPQDLLDVEVAFFKGDERSRTLKVKVNGDNIGEFDSTPGSTLSLLGIEEDEVSSVTLESVGIGTGDWISLLEVRFMVAA